MRQLTIIISLLLILSLTGLSQVDNILNKKLDSMRILILSQIPAPVIVQPQPQPVINYKPYVDSAIQIAISSKLQALNIRTMTTNQASFFKMDTLVIPNNTAWLYDYTLIAKIQGSLKISITHRYLLVTNIAGLYSYQDIQIPAITGTAGVGFTASPQKTGLEIWPTPNSSVPIDWTELYTKIQL